MSYQTKKHPNKFFHLVFKGYVM